MKNLLKDYLKELGFELSENYNYNLKVENDEIYYNVFVKNNTEFGNEAKFINMEEILLWMYKKIKK